jgi:hypothetical protein
MNSGLRQWLNQAGTKLWLALLAFVALVAAALLW